MGDKTSIEWTDATWNPIRGCSRVSEGCRNCYAEAVAGRFSGPGLAYQGLAIMKHGEAHWTGEIKFVEDHLEDPLRWKRPRRIFVNSMSDLFHEGVKEEWITAIFDVMLRSLRTTPHIFQILTKRPERMRDYCRKIWPLHETPAIQLGISAEDQPTLDARLPVLLDTSSAIKWLSLEPLLGPVILPERVFVCPANEPHPICPCIDWVVVGGESGHGARPMHPDWARALRDQCNEYMIPFFFKQWGEWMPIGAGLDPMVRVGKKRAGRLLDGREWSEYPE